MPGSYLQQPLASPELQACCDQLGNGTSVLAEESENHDKIHITSLSLSPMSREKGSMVENEHNKGLDHNWPTI
jgi:hypothetical protein